MSPTTRETILLIVQIASLLALVVYVIKTAEVAKETKASARAMEKSIEEMVEDRDMEYAPYIVVYFDVQTDSPIFDLVVSNQGRTIAHNVKISFDPPFQTSLKNFDLNNLSFLHQQIPAMPPGYELRTSIDRLESRLESEQLPRVYNVQVTYIGGLYQKLRKVDYVLDLNMFQGILDSHTSSLTDLTDAVEDIPKSIERLDRNLEKMTQELTQIDKKLEDVAGTKLALQELNETNKALEEVEGIRIALQELHESSKKLDEIEGIKTALQSFEKTTKSKVNKIW